MKRPMSFRNKPTVIDDMEDSVETEEMPMSRQASGESLDSDEPAETQVEPDRQMVKDFVDALDSKQFGYLQECIARRLDGEKRADESRGEDADKSPEFRFDEMSDENERSPKTSTSMG